MRVYFAGVNTHSYLKHFHGKYVLESFAEIRPLVERYRGTWAGSMLDSGAYTLYNSGKKVDLPAYIDYCLEHGSFYDAIISLDDIAGNVDISKKNLQIMKDAGIDSMPVYHQGEPLSILKEYCDGFDYVGLGFQRPIKNERPWLDKCWESIPAGKKIHGFAMTSYMADYPFYSVDSTSWLWELQALLGINGRAGTILKSLTPGELLDIIISYYERAPKLNKWNKKSTGPQKTLFEE